MLRHTFWYVAGGCGATLTLLVIVLFVLPLVAPPSPVTIESIHWKIEQTPPVNGSTEFAEQWINQSGPTWGFPFQIRAGGSFNDSLVIVNTEPYDVYLCSASIAPPLYIVNTSPALPMVAVPEEDNLLVLTLSVGAGAGSVVNVSGGINAVECGLP